jgi:N-acetylgalactosamine-N,N'-diacetylbacillosaminyl-diphospho-undecaprenol 4-alpha-N-acetylgalactosaminyltransferase
MKLAFIINSLAGGGAERVLSTLLNKLIEKHECYLILLEPDISYKLNSRIKIINLNTNSNDSGLKKLITLPILAYKISSILKENKFSLVTSFLYRANYINLLSNMFYNHKTIISERIAPSSMYNNNDLSSLVNKFLIKNLYPKANKIISVSKAIKYDLINNFNVKTEQKVIYNPYDIERIIDLSNLNIDYKINKEKSIITIGSLGKRKNHEMLIRSFSSLKDNELKLYILGIGELENYLKNLTIELNLENRVIFLGFDNNPYKYLSKCSLFVLASNSEGFPNVLMEAMICGCNVISTDCLSGPREILAPSSDISIQLSKNIEETSYGILVPIHDSELLTTTIESYIKNKRLRKSHRENIKTIINKFETKKILQQYEEIICAE